MRFEYSKRKWSRGSAWTDLIQHTMPVHVDGPHRFVVRNHDFRKEHTDPDFWCWIAARLSLDHADVLFEEPCSPPEEEDYGYTWDVWIDQFSGKPTCGFIAAGLVLPQYLSKAQVEDALVEQDRRMVVGRGGI